MELAAMLRLNLEHRSRVYSRWDMPSFAAAAVGVRRPFLALLQGQAVRERNAWTTFGEDATFLFLLQDRNQGQSQDNALQTHRDCNYIQCMTECHVTNAITRETIFSCYATARFTSYLSSKREPLALTLKIALNTIRINAMSRNNKTQRCASSSHWTNVTYVQVRFCAMTRRSQEMLIRFASNYLVTFNGPSVSVQNRPIKTTLSCTCSFRWCGRLPTLAEHILHVSNIHFALVRMYLNGRENVTKKIVSGGYYSYKMLLSRSVSEKLRTWMVLSCNSN